MPVKRVVVGLRGPPEVEALRAVRIFLACVAWNDFISARRLLYPSRADTLTNDCFVLVCAVPTRTDCMTERTGWAPILTLSFCTEAWRAAILTAPVTGFIRTALVGTGGLMLATAPPAAA